MHLALFAAIIGLSSFLLFLVQPIIAKQLLPWFGGSSAVWITCLVFFQVALLAGYTYSHLSTRYLRAQAQAVLHMVLLVGSLVFLPIIPGEFLKPDGLQEAEPQLVSVLLITVGAPFFMLSTTAPLFQRWIAPRLPEKTVYRLFALSNLGSLGGLLMFRFLIEPFATSDEQSNAWSIAYSAFVALALVLSAQRRRSKVRYELSLNAEAKPPRVRDYAIWLSLAGLGSIALLGTTSHLTQNIASIPFLWVVPLSLYLFSFAVVFDGRGGRGWYTRRWGVPAMQVAAVVMALALTASQGVLHISIAVPLYCVGLFVICMFCHGELAIRKPDARYLTNYYLALAAGGAAGGLLVTCVLPTLYDGFFELPMTLFLVASFGVATAWQKKVPRAVALIATVATCYYGIAYATFIRADSIWMNRNFYGSMRVQQIESVGVRRLVHGVIAHGEQSVDPSKALKPRSYFSATSGGGRAIVAAQARGPVTVGVIGLGVGTLAAYSRADDLFRFYELDPDVLRVAHEQSSYLRNAAGKVEHVLGDARLSLEKEVASATSLNYDVFVVDAFSSDSIPVHLLTQEALKLYLSVMKDDGLLALHVSNKFLDLPSVVSVLAAKHRLQGKLVEDKPSAISGGAPSSWVVLKRNGATWDPELADAPVLVHNGIVTEWTDRFSSLFPVLTGVSAREMSALIH